MKSSYVRRNGSERTKHAHADLNNGRERRKGALARLENQLNVEELAPASVERIKKEISTLKTRI